MFERLAHQRRLLGHGPCDLVARQHEQVDRTWQRGQRREEIRCSIATLRMVAPVHNHEKVGVGTRRRRASYQRSEQDNPLNCGYPLVRPACRCAELTDSLLPVQVSGAGRMS